MYILLIIVLILRFKSHRHKTLDRCCQHLWKKLGRKKSLKNSPRECDIDILDYNNIIIVINNLIKLFK